jgi:hypothetical protein
MAGERSGENTMDETIALDETLLTIRALGARSEQALRQLASGSYQGGGSRIASDSEMRGNFEESAKKMVLRDYFVRTQRFVELQMRRGKPSGKRAIGKEAAGRQA